jgi:diaminohydroxyphosphoribosylaminopyrimidine deaminase/5-amino-6-(5-phosphoribosylamino)uracil reductase
MTNLLVEGGAEVFGAFLDVRLVDEVHVFVAPVLLGGRSALSPVGGHGRGLAEALRFARWERQSVGGDTYLHAWTHSPQSPERERW